MKVGVPTRRARTSALLAAVILALLSVAGLAGNALAASPAAVTPEGEDTAATLQWEASINGRPVDQIDANDPLRLDPGEGAIVEVSLTNPTDAEVQVRSVRMDGTVMGLTMYNFTTRVDVVLPAGAQTTRTFDVDLIDLSGQATGLIPSRLQLLDGDRVVLQEASFPADIRGSVNSVYGVFGLAVLGITLLLLGGLLLRIHRTKMPQNRWLRALRFLPVGIGVGLVLTFTLSATRQLSPSATSWASLVLGAGAVAFLIGYVLPIGVSPEDETDSDGPADDFDDDDPPDDDLADDGADTLEVVGAGAGTQGKAPATGQAGHYWTSGAQDGDPDQPAAGEDDW